MRKHTKYVGALAAASALAAGYASAGSTAPTQSASATVSSGSDLVGQVHVGYGSQYEFRFVDLGSDLVEAGLNLSYDLNETFGLSAGAWYGSVNDSQTVDNSFNELDLFAAVSTDVGPVSLELGYITYFFQDADNNRDSQEVYLSAGMDLIWGVNASATYFYDFDSYNGWYLQPELTKSFEITDCLGINLAAGVGIADGHGRQIAADAARGTADGFQGWFVKAELPWQVRENVTFAPYVKYVDAEGDLVSDTPLVGGVSNRGGREHLIGGVKLTVGF